MLSRHTPSVVAACGLGSLFGGLIGLYGAPYIGFNETFSLIVGIFGGGLIGYIVVDIPGFIAGVQRSYHETLGKFYAVGERYRARRRFVLDNLVGWLCLSFTLGCFMAGLIYSGYSEKSLIVNGVPYIPMILIIAFVMMMMAFVTLKVDLRKDRKVSEKDVIEAGKFRRFGLWILPPILPFSILYGLYRCIAFLWRHRGDIGHGFAIFGAVCWAFLRQSFLYIHSDRRTLCFLDSLFGAVVGIFAGNALLGALAGMVIGLVSHELIQRHQNRQLAD